MALTPPPRNPMIPLFREVLRRYRNVTFVHVGPGDLVGDRCGEVIATDDHAWIFLDGSSTDGEFTATVGHELFHLAYPDEADETLIEGRAAELLVPPDEVHTACTRDEIEAVARRNGVDPQLVRARIRDLPDESLAG